jgi:hypothetical protein
MTRQRAIVATVLSTCCIAVAYGSAFVPGGTRWGVWFMVVGVATMVVSLMVLGAARRTGGVRRLRLPLAFTFVVIVGGFAAALLLPAEAAGARLVLGLPLRAAVVLYGVGLCPLLVLPLTYALTFDELTLRDEDLARVRELGRQYAAANARSEH